MRSQKVNLRNGEELGYGSNKASFQRKSTRSMSRYSQQNKKPLNEQRLQSNLQPPSPFSSSEQGSIQVKYLSYLVQVIDSAPQDQDRNQIQQHYHKAEYWRVIFESAIYLKKDSFRDQVDDNLIMDQFQPYFKPGRIHPQALNEKGQQLLTNGYFMSAYAVATGRKRKSFFIFKYLMQYFINQHEISTNKQQFMYILQNYVHTDNAQQILHFNLTSTPDGNQHENLNEQRSLIPINQDLIRRHQMHRAYSNNSSECSKTIVLQEESCCYQNL